LKRGSAGQVLLVRGSAMRVEEGERGGAGAGEEGMEAYQGCFFLKSSAKAGLEPQFGVKGELRRLALGGGRAE